MEEDGDLKSVLVNVVAEALHAAWSQGARYGMSLEHAKGEAKGVAVKRIASPYRCSDRRNETQASAERVLAHMRDLGVLHDLD